MKDWKRISEGFNVSIPEQDLRAAAASLDRLEAAFRPLVMGIPLETEPAYISVRFPEDGE